MAYLRQVCNPDERTAFERIANWPTRGIGAKSLERLLLASSESGQTVLDSAREAQNIPGIPKRAAASLTDFASLIDRLCEMSRTQPVGEVLKTLLEETDILCALKAEKDGGEERAENVTELLTAAMDFDATQYEDDEIGGLTDTERFVQHVSLLADVDQDDPDADAVLLMTLHSAKGLEFPVVFIVGMEEGLFPHAMTRFQPSEMEEERRLFYVGITRAEETLNLSYSAMRRRGAEMTWPDESSFLAEIPGHLLHR
jgi:DNA helicase II / ATP-dependent DNA helicase PcrA